MKKVLIAIDSYLPGYRKGGPQRSVENICSMFADIADIYLVTKNHDVGINKVYDVETDRWLDIYGIHVMYVADKRYTCTFFMDLYKQFDIIYACEFLATCTVWFMLANRLLYKQGKKLYVAPMGIFSRNALRIKAAKKRSFIFLGKVTGIYNNIIWSFTSEIEKQDTINTLGEKRIRQHIVAEDVPRLMHFADNRGIVENFRDENIKEQGSLRIIFLSRICEMKNLLQCMRILCEGCHGSILFDIYGQIDDEDYWEKCRKEMENLPDNIEAEYKGEVEPGEVEGILRNYDVFFLPTKGENFCHTIYEALASGCIPVISDKTPWQDLSENKCGSVIELENITAFRDVINKYVDMGKDQITYLKKNAIEYAERKFIQITECTTYRQVFAEE